MLLQFNSRNIGLLNFQVDFRNVKVFSGYINLRNLGLVDGDINTGYLSLTNIEVDIRKLYSLNFSELNRSVYLLRFIQLNINIWNLNSFSSDTRNFDLISLNILRCIDFIIFKFQSWQLDSSNLNLRCLLNKINLIDLNSIILSPKIGGIDVNWLLICWENSHS